MPSPNGFLGKWFVFSVVVRADMIGIATAEVSMSGVALGYCLRVVVAMYMEPEPEGQAPPMIQRGSASFATVFCGAMVVLLSILPGAFLGSVF